MTRDVGKALLFASGVALAAGVMWGFTVDDALISIRYAHHLGAGLGYRFNADGPSTDGVTPLPWPFLLVPLAGAAPFAALVRVKALGVLLTAAAGALVGARHATSCGRSLVSSLLMATCLPLAAYAASGMETPVAVLLCTLAVTTKEGALFAGLAAAFRPELLPWAVTVAGGRAIGKRPSGMVRGVALAAVPFTMCALARWVVFGHVAPLAVLAKPSDLSHGLVYTAAALLACGAPVLLFARPPTRLAATIAAGLVVHALAVAAAGGDSMPYARLFVPLVPGIVLAHAAQEVSWGWWARSGLALLLSAYVWVSAAPRGREVMAQRRELVARARPLLAGATRVATVDVGWVSVATDDAHVVDLAGLTDPDIAALHGGHTSKDVSGAMLLDRQVDALVLYEGHAITARLGRDPLVRGHFRATGDVPGYVIARREPGN